ncbi:hypothetical protein CYMTET_15282 [Cymbomonas tetramitiformis]|uniref:Uncharacterized protein n=1 Tax=Cymbomonas tetramitiformis TaxID=36881 RepID=A0AAE0GES2_9CHLO|nr:hypothetical protein CYMTET_15282 [Cymbomonas tetramitiformis]
MTSFPNVKALLDYTGKLGKLKLGSTASALTHQKAVLVEAKEFLPWFTDLTEERPQQMLKALVEPVGRLFHQTQNGIRLVLGPTVVIPKPSATAVQAGVIRKAFLAVGRAIRAAEALAATWEKEQEDEEPSHSSEEEDGESPPRRQWPAPQSPEPAKAKKGEAAGMSPASSRKRAKAMSRVRRACRAVMPILRAAEGVPHVFGDELEWNIRPEACPELAKLCVNEGDLATLDDLENAREVKGAALNDYVAFLRGSAVSVTKNLRFEDLTEASTPSTAPNNDTPNTLMKDAGVMKAAEKLFKGDYFAADVVPHATGAIGALNVASGAAERTGFDAPAARGGDIGVPGVFSSPRWTGVDQTPEAVFEG